MSVLKRAFLILFLLFSISCARNAGEEFRTAGESVNIEEAGNSSSKSAVYEDGSRNEQANFHNATVPVNYESVDNKLSFLFFKFSWFTWKVLFSILLVVLFLLLYRIFLIKAKLNHKNKAVKKKEKEIDYQKSLVFDFRKQVQDLQRENRTPKNNYSPPMNKSAPDNEGNVLDEGPKEIVFTINEPDSVHSEERKKPVYLYAEKATGSNIFSRVTEKLDEHKSVFKLQLEDRDAVTAQFEVVDFDFVLRMAVNSPDTYLYTVCKPENSNQNFTGDIITTQKGIAHKVDGNWIVKEENKARIKFQ